MCQSWTRSDHIKPTHLNPFLTTKAWWRKWYQIGISYISTTSFSYLGRKPQHKLLGPKILLSTYTIAWFETPSIKPPLAIGVHRPWRMTTEGLQCKWVPCSSIHPSKMEVYHPPSFSILWTFIHPIWCFSSSQPLGDTHCCFPKRVPRVSEDSSECFTPSHEPMPMPIVNQDWQHFVCYTVYPRQLVHCGEL